MYLVSGISGEPLYAAMASSSEEWLGASSKLDASAYNSAEFYTTANESSFIDGVSASAIASAYQVVSSTATQLYAGTAYVTSINEAPVSAARAGNAANASLSNSAWYDGTGRLISALPDSAAVSAIASSYVESGVSSKQDTLSFAYNTADQISSINGSALGGMDEAAVSGIASAYAESAASSKLDSSASSSFYSIDNPSGFLTAAYTPTFGYNTANQISSIDGSALGGMDEAAVSGIASAYAESAVSAASGNYYPSTSNPSGYLTAQTQASWSESASASPSYIVDKPDLVDIVAGPGIVVDNPDGNTLRVSTDENYETVLWSGSANQSGPFTLNEAYTNFQYVQIKYQNDSSNTPLNAGITKFPTDASQMKIVMPVGDEEPYYKVRLMTLTFSSTSATVKSNSVARYLWNTGGACSVSTAAAQAPYITEIVGIHRIANN